MTTPESIQGPDHAQPAPPSFGTTDAEFLAAIIEHVAHPIFVKDRAFRFVLVNRALCDMTGYSREQMLGKTDYDFFPKVEADFFRKKDADMFESGSRQLVDEEFITDSSGRRHVLATTKVPLRGADGQVTHLVGIIHEISRLKAAEEALRHANELLERRVAERTAALAAAQEQLVRKERLAVLGQIAGGLAHQIRNPLGAIANAAYILKRALANHPNPGMEEPTTIILEEAWKANKIITGLLDYARARPALRVPCSIDNVLHLALRNRTIPEHIRLHEQIPNLPAVLADPDQIREVFGNLIQNAIEAMTDAGTLSLIAAVVHDLPDDRIVVTVADTGPGIPAEVQRRIFQPLVTTKPNGLGLGLTTARMLVENQGGTIRMESIAGKGTRFDVSLPTAGDARASSIPPER